MPVQAVDWTVDKLLSFMRDVNQKAALQRSSTQANRMQYQNVLVNMKKVPEGPAKQKVRDSLTAWIHKQVEIENRVKDFDAKWTAAKNAVKRTLQIMNVTAPDYLEGLGQLQLAVPVAVVALAVAAGAALAWWAAANKTQNKALSVIEDGYSLVLAGRATPEEVAEIINAGTNAGNPKDPLGLKPLLDAAVPVGLIVLAILVLPKVVGNRRAA